MSETCADLVSDVLAELVITEPGQSAPPELAAIVLSRINQTLDNWNADRESVYYDVFTNYTFTPSLTPHTIGPTGTFVVAQRPESIEGGSVISLTPTPVVKLSQLRIRDAAWWNWQKVQGLTSTLPTDLYYDPTWPNGSLYFWPVPTTAYTVQLQTRAVLVALALTDTFTMPPGYRNALMLTAAESAAQPLAVQASPKTIELGKQARARVFANNVDVPDLDLRGPIASNSRDSDFNYRSGLPASR